MPRFTSLGTLDPDIRLLHFSAFKKIDVITVNEYKMKYKILY